MPRNMDEMPLDEQLAIQGARDRLLREFEDRLDVDTVDAVLQASWEHMDSVAKIKLHVPLLAERFARAQLWAAAKMRGHRDAVPSVLFIDTHDAGRGRMAKALFLHRVGAHGLAFSVGTDPNAALEEPINEVMEELGISMIGAFPKPYTTEILQAADRIVTFAGGAEVPIPDPDKHEVWEVEDPRGRSLEEVREIRDELASRVQGLIDRLGITVPVG